MGALKKLIKSIVDAFEERTGLIKIMTDLAEHPVPPDTGWWYVFGSATAVAFMIQVVTGIALATSYVSSSGSAYDSLQFITTHALMGNLLRGMHYFGASAMVLLVGIHMGQVFLMGCYKYPREFNWLTGVVLLFLTLAMGFTGQLLRWDQNAVWSVVVGAEQAGRTPIIGDMLARFLLAGKTIGGATLSRFFAFHVFFIPAIIFGFVGIHLFLVLHDGISEPPKVGEPVDPATYREKYEKLVTEKGVPFWPDAAWRDVVFCVAVVLAVFILALVFGPPTLDKPPNPSMLAKDPAPDWYLLWYFALLALIPHKMTTPVILLAPLTGIIVLLLVPIASNKGERHPRKRPWAVASVIVIVMMIGTLWVEAIREPWSPDFRAEPLPTSVVGTNIGPVVTGAALFHEKGCEYCHEIEGFGGHRGPSLTWVGDRLTRADLTVRIMNGGYNMPAFAGLLSAGELDDLTAFLESRHKER
ncbi:MAG TPA: cytochrome b N-terminal domain-containing protein [Candidatus Binataceae bacterium]|nr:cytochrome b N-terminal domain-containing protein [Candidatus Binataceae bacterium]